MKLPSFLMNVRAEIKGFSRFKKSSIILFISCLVVASSSCLAQSGKAAEKPPAVPFARPTDPLIEGKFIVGKISTPEGENYQFVAAAGSMVTVTNKVTNQVSSFVMAPNLEFDSAGNKTVLPGNVDRRADLIIQAFRVEGGALSETGFSALWTKKAEGFPDPGGTGCTVLAEQVVNWLGDKEIIYSGTTCCVSCGTYQICGTSVTSTCGSCTAGGPGVINKDVPPPVP